MPISLNDQARLDEFLGVKARLQALTTEDLVKNSLQILLEGTDPDRILRGMRRFTKDAGVPEDMQEAVLLKAAGHLLTRYPIEATVEKQAAAWALTERFAKVAKLDLRQLLSSARTTAGDLAGKATGAIGGAYQGTLGKIQNDSLRRALLGLLLGGTAGGAIGAFRGGKDKGQSRGMGAVRGALYGGAAGAGVGALSGLGGSAKPEAKESMDKEAWRNAVRSGLGKGIGKVWGAAKGLFGRGAKATGPAASNVTRVNATRIPQSTQLARYNPFAARAAAGRVGRAAPNAVPGVVRGIGAAGPARQGLLRRAAGAVAKPTALLGAGAAAGGAGGYLMGHKPPANPEGSDELLQALQNLGPGYFADPMMYQLAMGSASPDIDPEFIQALSSAYQTSLAQNKIPPHWRHLA